MCRIECGTYFTLRAECNICHDNVTLQDGSCSDIWDHLQTVHALIKFCQEDLAVKDSEEDNVKEEAEQFDEDICNKDDKPLYDKGEDLNDKNPSVENDKESSDANKPGGPIKISIGKKEKKRERGDILLTFGVKEHFTIHSETSFSCNYCDYSYEAKEKKKTWLKHCMRQHIIRKHQDVLSDKDRELGEQYRVKENTKKREKYKDKMVPVRDRISKGGIPAILKFDPWLHFMQRSESDLCCNYCDYIYRGKYNNCRNAMKRHVIRKHKDVLDDEDRAVAERYHTLKKLQTNKRKAVIDEQVCSFCGRTYLNKNSLNCHLRVVHKWKSSKPTSVEMEKISVGMDQEEGDEDVGEDN